MIISDAQREIRTRFVGGVYGQLVSGVIWLASAALATWASRGRAVAQSVVQEFVLKLRDLYAGTGTTGNPLLVS